MSDTEFSGAGGCRRLQVGAHEALIYVCTRALEREVPIESLSERARRRALEIADDADLYVIAEPVRGNRSPWLSPRARSSRENLLTAAKGKH